MSAPIPLILHPVPFLLPLQYVTLYLFYDNICYLVMVKEEILRLDVYLLEQWVFLQDFLGDLQTLRSAFARLDVLDNPALLVLIEFPLIILLSVVQSFAVVLALEHLAQIEVLGVAVEEDASASEFALLELAFVEAVLEHEVVPALALHFVVLPVPVVEIAIRKQLHSLAFSHLTHLLQWRCRLLTLGNGHFLNYVALVNACAVLDFTQILYSQLLASILQVFKYSAVILIRLL